MAFWHKANELTTHARAFCVINIENRILFDQYFFVVASNGRIGTHYSVQRDGFFRLLWLVGSRQIQCESHRSLWMRVVLINFATQILFHQTFSIFFVFLRLFEFVFEFHFRKKGELNMIQISFPPNTVPKKLEKHTFLIIFMIQYVRLHIWIHLNISK